MIKPIGWWSGMTLYVAFLVGIVSKHSKFLNVQVPWDDNANITIVVIAATLLAVFGRPKAH